MANSGSENSREVSLRDEQNTVFVGNMPYEMSWRDLKAFFSKFGRVTYAKCCTDIITRKRRGIGFVQFKQEADAYNAKSAPDDQLRYKGRILRVKCADQNYPRQPPGAKTDSKTSKTDGMSNTDPNVEDKDDITAGSCFDMLNDDCLVHILLFLDPLSRIRLERVSRVWKRCSEKAFRQQRHMTIRKQFKSFRVFTEVMLYKLMTRCSNSFKSLDISLVSSNFGNKALEIIGSQLNLESNNNEMVVSCCICSPFYSNTMKAPSPLTADGDVVNLVFSLSIRGNPGGLMDIFVGKDGATNDQAMDPRWSWLVVYAIQAAPLYYPQGFEMVSECIDLPESLKASSCSQLSEKGFWYLFHNCQQLQFLDCFGNSGITGKCFKHATSHFQYLHATCCTKLGPEGVLQLSQRCPNLKCVDFRECRTLDFQTLEKLFQLCAKLTDIHLGGLEHCASTGIHPNHVINKLADPSQMTRLCIDNSNLNDSDVQFVCSSCPQLVELDISCNHLTDCSLIQLSSLHNLQVLIICHLFNITSSSLIDVIQSGKLKVLRAQGCKKLENSLFVTMARTCLQLEELDVAGVTNLSDIMISAFVDVLRSQPHRKLVMYVWGNDFYDCLPVMDCPNLSVISNYRQLYQSHPLWLYYADESPHIIVMPSWDDEDRGQGLSICVYNEEDSDDSDFLVYDFLENDDPVEAEYFEWS